MSKQLKVRCTPEEYLARERQTSGKSEFYGGEIFAMTGASRWHNLVVSNILRELSSQLKGRPCVAYPSDMRVKVSTTGLYTYPDVVVVCGDEQFEDTEQDTLLEPDSYCRSALAFHREVRSRGESAHYRKLGLASGASPGSSGQTARRTLRQTIQPAVTAF